MPTLYYTLFYWLVKAAIYVGYALMYWHAYNILMPYVRTMILRIRLPYPPGPPAKGRLQWFFKGNADDLSQKYPWISYMEWAKIYGNILHLRAFQQHILVLNSVEDANELLQVRGNVNNSSRPALPMLDMMGFSFNTAVRGNTPKWNNHRSIFQQTLRYDAALKYRPVQTDKVKDMLHGILTCPGSYGSYIQRYISAVVMSVMYGYDVVPKDDPFIKLVEDAEDAFLDGSSMKWIVNSVPVLQHIPAWFPGAGFKRYAHSVRKLAADHIDIPFQYALDSMKTSETEGNPRHSVVSSYLHSDQFAKYNKEALKEVAGTAYGAGVITTSSTVLIFIIAMITNPRVQQKAQHEIDALTDGSRMVGFGDQNKLPYLQAIFREVMRWRPIIPFGFPHLSEKDDTYKGYFIENGTMLMPNVWAMSRNSEKYEDPESFIPERFIDENGQLTGDDVNFLFGFGRRICPGQHLASASIWLAMVTILQTFDLQHLKDSSGKDIPLDIEYHDGVVSQPLPFECSITPRSDQAKQLILEACEKL